MEDLLMKNLILGVLLVIVFIIFRLFPPKKMNSIYGYRSSKSTQSIENWKFANKYFAIKGLIVGILSIAIGLLSTYLIASYSTGITVISTISLLILIFVATERRLSQIGS